MKTSIIRNVAFAILILFVAGCDEDAFVKIIEVEQADFPPKLAVRAILDTDNGGTFTFSMTEAHSIGYYETFKAEQQNIVHNGTVRLFENDSTIFSSSGEFNISGMNYTFHNISAVAGRTYRLEMDIEGYDKATATAVMPDAPLISDLFVDVEHPVKKNNIRYVPSLSTNAAYDFSSYYVPFSLNITDNTSSPDFYSFQIEYYSIVKYEYEGYDLVEDTITGLQSIYTSNLALIQDNPDVESADLMMEGENVDLYGFGLMMLTDATFANTDTRLDLYCSEDIVPGKESYPGPYDDKSSGEQLVRNTLIVGHHTEEAFKQYRSMVFQLAGLGFFSEPVYITSNMENAYGGFSVQNTVRIVLFEAKVEYP
ncbi:MAG: DUF4249 domain-containing protein [Prevotellaceae bacterium]|jgi:hypothetical protein|nr:DUF4249 domain-containing protein [Prevotellaceae bacterium]